MAVLIVFSAFFGMVRADSWTIQTESFVTIEQCHLAGETLMERRQFSIVYENTEYICVPALEINEA